MDTTEKILEDHIKSTFEDMDRIQAEIDTTQDYEEFGIKAKAMQSLTNKVFHFLTPMQMLDFTKGKLYHYEVEGEDYLVVDGKNLKVAMSEDYNFIFNKNNGMFMRWGKTYEDDPEYSPIGPEILDLEISVNGCPNNCRFCYKNNTNEPATNMSFETFKKIIDSFPKTLTQVAFGITGVQTNPDFIKMMEYCREIGVVPNFTLSGIDLTDDIAKKISKLVGALAVSAYKSDKNVCYNTVKKFTDLGIRQTNIHLLVATETLDFVYEVLNDRINDNRLSRMGSIVFLGVKPKGRAKDGFHSLSTDQYKKLINFCFDNGISCGFDSCSCPKYEAAIKDMDLPQDKKDGLIGYGESCESSLLSSYINVRGEYWHCSFSEKEDGIKSINCLDYDDFLKVWYSDVVKEFRNKSIAGMIDGCRYCTVFPSINI